MPKPNTGKCIVTEPTVSVSEFVALLNQTLEYAYPSVTITGELSNVRVSKNRWLYFDLKDEQASVKFFGTVYQLPGPLEDGMMVAVRGVPRLHPLYGFSVTVQHIQPAGEGSIKKAAKLLQAKLAAEGLFDAERKRPLPYPPRHIGLVTSGESAAYRDFVKVLGARWGGIQITHIDVQVQGEPAVTQVAQAIGQLNALANAPDVLVLTRGGGSADDLQAFSTEQVTRAVAASRIPTLVAIGHEVDVSLAELAADQRASTPSNAAELLVPDRRAMVAQLHERRGHLARHMARSLHTARQQLVIGQQTLKNSAEQIVRQAREQLVLRKNLLQAYNPAAALQRGYALVRKNEIFLKSARKIRAGDLLHVEMSDAHLAITVKTITMKQDDKTKPGLPES